MFAREALMRPDGILELQDPIGDGATYLVDGQPGG
jgi:hypothetical protein